MLRAKRAQRAQRSNREVAVIGWGSISVADIRFGLFHTRTRFGSGRSVLHDFTCSVERCGQEGNICLRYRNQSRPIKLGRWTAEPRDHSVHFDHDPNKQWS